MLEARVRPLHDLDKVYHPSSMDSPNLLELGERVLGFIVEERIGEAGGLLGF